MNKYNEHPEIEDIKNICSVSPDLHDVCQKISEEKKLEAKKIRLKKDKELDKALKDTFPASDATAEY
jgi:hypothetical protein